MIAAWNSLPREATMRYPGFVPMLTILFCAGFASSQENNSLTSEEAAKGWILLWDGKSVTNWTPELVANWKTAEGTLTAAPGAFFWLRHAQPFADFILKAEFRMLSPEADSGIFIRAADKGDPSRTGYQININNVNQEFGTGSVVFRVKYNGSPVTAKEWHRYEITAEGNHITVVLDGKKTIDYRDSSSREGYIGLQFIKPEDVEFRNVKLLPLAAGPAGKP
jgi:hypothetical protein